jgi:hypothetical protein
MRPGAIQSLSDCRARNCLFRRDLPKRLDQYGAGDNSLSTNVRFVEYKPGRFYIVYSDGRPPTSQDFPGWKAAAGCQPSLPFLVLAQEANTAGETWRAAIDGRAVNQY